MLVFPNAKINLGLHVTRKRADGFHDVETVMFPVNWTDALEFIEAGATRLDVSGIELPGHSADNLVMKAYHTLQQKAGLPPLHIHLHKQIPTGAGLGGGSADAAFMLKALNTHFHLDLSEDVLEAYAADLGSDCAFFIRNRPAVAKGRGEALQPVEVALAGYHLVLVHPGFAVATAAAYAGVTPAQPDHALEALISKPPEEWNGVLGNDFEQGIFKKHPVISRIKDQLYDMGAVYASMSGSGSAVFGVFRQKPEVRGKFPQGYSVVTATADALEA